MGAHATPGSWQDIVWSIAVIAAAWTLAMSPIWLDLPIASDTVDLLAVVLGGVAIGVAQWLVVARRFGAGAWWILLYGLGWAVGLACGFAFGSFFGPDIVWTGTVGGTLAGVMLWATLRRQVARAGWWIPLSVATALACCWAGVFAGVTLYDDHDFSEPAAYLAGSVICGLVSGVLTTLTQRWLERPGWRLR